MLTALLVAVHFSAVMAVLGHRMRVHLAMGRAGRLRDCLGDPDRG
jgi:hypothetical protein